VPPEKNSGHAYSQRLCALFKGLSFHQKVKKLDHTLRVPSSGKRTVRKVVKRLTAASTDIALTVFVATISTNIFATATHTDDALVKSGFAYIGYQR